MRVLSIIVCIFLMINAEAQNNISGTVSDRKANPIIGANIFFEGSYDGTISNAEGQFKLSTNLKGKQKLVVSFMGFQKFSLEILLQNTDTTISIVLEPQLSELNEVSIVAGVFNASDKKKSATMTSFDIATTPSAMGDIYGAYATMPGVQKVGEDGMLFVRGGDSYEVKTFMDGMLVQTPFFSKMPDIPTRGRYSPLLFSETLFSTGGYSAEYGQALSSIVDLNTVGLEIADKTSISFMTVGANVSAARKWENSSLSLTGLYANNALHHTLFKQSIDWVKDPVMTDGTMMYRKVVGETGMLKVLFSYNYNSMHLNYDNFEEASHDDIEILNNTFYINTTYTDQINEKWLIRSGVSFNQDFDNITMNGSQINSSNNASQAKLVFTNLTTKSLKIRIGADFLRENYVQEFVADTTISLHLIDMQPTFFVESELKLSSKFALRLGARTEHSSLMETQTVSPRISTAYKTGTYSQLSVAYGKFHQKPGNNYMLISPLLSAEKSEHYILNFQYKKDKRILRLEAYVKEYVDLVKYDELYGTDPLSFDNSGDGFARGFDFFWRDQKTFEGSDYWISYSYIDTRRNYQDFPISVAPAYASTHNLAFVYKYFITALNTFTGFTYSYASGRPYDDKNSTIFMNSKTKAYNDISLNITHITQLFNKETVIHMNVTNLLGFKNIYSYKFSNTPDENGIYASQAVIPSVGRQAVILLLISL